MKRLLSLWGFLAILLCTVCSCSHGKEGITTRVLLDSLNQISYGSRYRNLDSTNVYATRVISSSDASPSQRAFALNSLAFVSFMRMDYEGSQAYCHQVYRATNSEIERLAADVGLMRICQRTSANREFFDNRTRATKRLQRIEEELSELDEQDRQRAASVMAEFHLISATYYNNFQQQEQTEDELAYIEPIEDLQHDTAQWLYYTYMKGVCPARENEGNSLFDRYINLTNCLRASETADYPWIEASSLQALSELLMEKGAVETIEERRHNSLKRINIDDLTPDNLSVSLAQRALQIFTDYGDAYKVIDANCTVGACLNRQGDFETALMILKHGLDLVNDYHYTHYPATDSTWVLQLYQPGDSAELWWLNKGKGMSIPESILRIREQISAAFSGLGDKDASDYNRNIYLDLLAQVRQNREYDSRANALESETSTLNFLFLFTLALLILTFVLLYYISRYWQKRNARYLSRLRVMLGACKQVTSAVSSDVSTCEEVYNVVARVARPYMHELLGEMQLTIVPAEEKNESEDEDIPVEMVEDENHDESEVQESPAAREEAPEAPGVVNCFPLQVPDRKESLGTFTLTTPRQLTRDERTIVSLMIPYFAVAVENGLTFVELGDEYNRIEKEHYIYQLHLATNKCENVVKKTCFSIVTGITPYLDRIVNEVHKLLSSRSSYDEETKRRKFLYIEELVDKIDEYNEILAQWIKMRQGALNLQIETFSLTSLFATLQKSRQTFEAKGLTFTVEPTQAAVKADKALTLFMMNTLAENARKYTPAGGTVTLTAREADDYVEISVQDTGVGLSQTDIDRILGEKVYDSRLIGSNGDKAQEVARNKGYGFGLINCKGIIDKYRKTGTLFKVCSFGIESEQGRGSRFYFRLPKGVKRLLGMIVFLLFTVTGSLQADTMLARAALYADSVYECNVNRHYQQALLYADSALGQLNLYYMSHASFPRATLKLHGSGEAAELSWWRSGFCTDSLVEEVYHNILYVRNEVAVAALALRMWDDYHYNDRAYSSLYRLIHEDKSIEDYCDSVQRSANNKLVAIVLCVLLLVIIIFVFYTFYFRQWILYRINLRQTLDVNRKLFSADLWNAREAGDAALIARRVGECIFSGMNDLLSIKKLAVSVYSEEKQQLCTVYFPQGASDEWLDEHIEKCYEKEKTFTSQDGTMLCLPLMSETGDDHHCSGVLAYALDRVSPEGELLMGELIASYVSVVVYNAVVKLAHKYRDIEQVQDDTRRAVHEENKLHVQNQVLDNCFSVIKHETIYYPSRIKQIVEKMLDGNAHSQAASEEQIRNIEELVSYYKDIFTTLSLCAARQLDEITFRRTLVPVRNLVDDAADYFQKGVRRAGVPLTFETKVQDVTVIGDRYLLEFLLHNLIDEALASPGEGTVRLEVSGGNEFVNFAFTDTRRSLTPEELSQLFVPSLARMYSGSDGTLKGTEYLVCKQIVREHDDYVGRRGCRIEALPCNEGGFTVLFTIPRKI